MATHNALGRGLNALFSSADGAQEDVAQVQQPTAGNPDIPGTVVRDIPINNIRPNRHQPRVNFDPAALEDLSQSIKLHGVQQPLVVTLSSEDNQFELVAGERRLRASKLAGLSTVPCLVKKFSNQQRYEVALIENLQREDLNPLEEAMALDGIMKEYGLIQDQVASAIGKSRSTVANMLRYLRLHDDVQSALRSGTITEGHAKCLAGVSEHAEQLRFLAKIINEKMTVRDLEHALSPQKEKKKGAGAPKKAADLIPEARKYEEDLQRVLGRRVEIQSSGKKGWIRFAFYSPWDLEMLLKRLELVEGKAGEPAESDPEPVA